MGRPVKTGLNYFSMDVDIFFDEKIEFVSAKYGLAGEAIVFRLLTKIYRNSYYLPWDEDVLILFSSKLIGENAKETVDGVVKELLKRDFFSEEIFNTCGVLTSHGIQKRYLKACEDCKRKNIDIDPRFDLTGYNKINSGNIPGETRFTQEETQLNPELSAQSKVKESKLNESEIKLNKSETEINQSDSTEKENHTKPEITIIKRNNYLANYTTSTSFFEECFTLFHLALHAPPDNQEKNQIRKAIKEYLHMLDEDVQLELVKSVCRRIQENKNLGDKEKRAYFFGTLRLLQQEECAKISRSEAKSYRGDISSLATGMRAEGF